MSNVWGTKLDTSQLPDVVSEDKKYRGFLYRIFPPNEIHDPHGQGYVLAEIHIGFDQCLTPAELEQIISRPIPPLTLPATNMDEPTQFYPAERTSDGTFIQFGFYEDQHTGCVGEIDFFQTSAGRN
jgi:hypothetical protein